jgi:cystathionine beta-lyase/cystathionine gamma-synthase
MAEMDLSYILNQLGEEETRWYGVVAPALAQSSIFAMPNVAAMRAALGDEYASHIYTRGNNPTVAILRKKLAALEGAEDALVLASGAAAVSAAALAAVRAGDHVLAVARPYSWTKTLVQKHLPRFGVRGDFVDAREVDAVAAALLPETKLVVLESPNSLTFEQQDLGAIAALCKARGIRTMCDNSYATPLGQSPIALGVDLVVHSATKYLNGHSDVVAGVICGSEALLRDSFAGPYMTLGAFPSPHDAWLMLRGLRTLGVRMERIGASAARVVEYLRTHPRVMRLHYPQSPGYPQPELTARQLRGASGLFSVELDADLDGIERCVDALRRFLITVSWGGYESLVFPVAGARDWRGREQLSTVPVNLVRFSIGLEEPDVLIADLEQALARI